MDTFRKSYRAVEESFGSFVGASESDVYVDKVQSSIDEAVRRLDETVRIFSKPNCPPDTLKGFLFETWHAETFNVDVTRQGGAPLRAYNPQATTGPDTSKDILIKDDVGSTISEWQLKCYKHADETAKALSDPKYEGMGKVGPSDQLDAIKQSSDGLGLKNQETRPDQASQYKDTSQNVSTHITEGDFESKPISEPSMKTMAKEYQQGKMLDREKYGFNTESVIKWTDIARESGEAALNAALLTAVLKAAPHLVESMGTLIKEGSIDKDAFRRAGLAALSGASQGAIRGGVAAAITASCKTGLLGASFKIIPAPYIGAATAVGMNAIQNAVRLCQGDLSNGQFAEACLRDAMILSISMYGASVGQVLIPVPILGALIGNFIGGICGDAVFGLGEKIFFACFIESGVSFLDIVKQDYRIPESVLRQAGFDLIDLDKLDLDYIKLDTLDLDIIELDKMDLIFLRRGLIGVNTIGFIN